MMIFLFFLLSCAATVFSEEAVVKKIPIFVPTFQALTYDELGLLSYRILPTPENVYKGVLKKPLIIVSLAVQNGEAPSFQFAPGGLQKLLKYPETKKLAEQLTNNDQITIVIYQKSSIPLLTLSETLQTTLKVPGHITTLETLMEPPPLVVLIRKNELESLNFLARLGEVSDLIVEGNDIRVSRDHKQPMNYYAPPAPAADPYDSALYLVYPDTRNPDDHSPASSRPTFCHPHSCSTASQHHQQCRSFLHLNSQTSDSLRFRMHLFGFI